jgi:hypothetical protein
MRGSVAKELRKWAESASASVGMVPRVYVQNRWTRHGSPGTIRLGECTRRTYKVLKRRELDGLSSQLG